MAESPRKTVLLRNATVISMDSDNKILKNCDIMIQDSEIVQVGPKLSIDSKLDTIDATDCIIAPGFIDGHHHLWQQLIRSVATDWCMPDYMSHVRLCYGSLYTAEDVYLANHVAALDLICHGVTTVVDHRHILNSPAHADAAVQALKDASIRGSFCYGFYENPALPSDFRSIDTTSSDHDTIRRIEDARRIRYKYFATNRWEHELLTFGVAPDEAEAVPIDVLKEQIRIGRELDATVITAHVGMGYYDVGNRIVSKLGDSNVLASDLLFSHGSEFTNEECDLLSKAKEGVIATPETELQMGMGHPVVFCAKSRGCNVGLGIDITSNQSNDMFAQMRLLLQTERARDHEKFGGIPTEIKRKSLEVLHTATIGGAKALGIDHLVGSIEVGKKADLIMVPCTDINVVPVIDPVRILMFNANSSNIDLAMINGRILKRGGKFANKDWEMLRKEVGTKSMRLFDDAQKVLMQVGGSTNT